MLNPTVKTAVFIDRTGISTRLKSTRTISDPRTVAKFQPNLWALPVLPAAAKLRAAADRHIKPAGVSQDHISP